MRENNKRIYCIVFLLIDFILFIIGIYYIGIKKKEKFLTEYDTIKEIYGIYEKIVNSKEIKIDDKTTIIKDNNSLYGISNTNFNAKIASEKLIEFSNQCKEKGIDFLYIVFPNKTTSKDFKEYGLNSNKKEINDELIELVEDKINVLNIESILYEQYDKEDIFYKTDHHWKTRYALLAAKETANYLNNKFDYQLDVNKLEEDQFEYRKFLNIWIGETGRKVSKTWSGLDDFELIIPKYNTSFLINQKIGNFSLLIDTKILREKKNYYNDNLYYSYCIVCKNEKTIHNNLINGKKVLLIQDSYAMAYAPFLSLVVEDITFYDLRREEKELQKLLDENDFDIVIVAYSQIFRSMMYDYQ